jgi:hypothetical protein
MSTRFADIAERLLDKGYTPIPVIAGQKRPAIKNWTNLNYETSPHLLEELCTKYPNASAGILLGDVCAIDIDVLDDGLAHLCKNVVTSKLGDAPCRFGNTPKSALFFRVKGPSFKKLLTGSHTVNGQKAQIEFLCEGQQVVVFGTHPETQKPYYWVYKDLLEVPLCKLPTITESEAREVLKDLELLIASKATAPRTGSSPASASSEFKWQEARVILAHGFPAAEQSGSAKALEGRNGFLFSRGCALRARAAEEHEIRAELHLINQRASVLDHENFSQGPLDHSDVEQIVSSVMRYDPSVATSSTDDVIKKLNERHAVVMVGGKCVIANELPSASGPYKEITFSSPADIRAWYANELIGQGKNRTSAGKVWLSHADRRQYQGIVFAPGKDTPGFLNLYQGFAVEPSRGDYSRIIDHIRNNICKADEEISDYLLAWMADCVQNTGRRPGVAVVLRGRQGTGKSILCEQFGKLFGPHFIHISHSGHLTGNFNAHLKDKIVVYADEAFWAGDKKAEGVLKAMITEDTQQIEMKGKDVFTVQNHIRLLISSNHRWVVPAGNEERRFFVIDVGDARMQDKTYFGALVDQMNNGGREAFLQYLLDYDLNGIDLRTPPNTNALSEQKVYSASPIQSWLLERLSDGSPTSEGREWPATIPISELYDDYLHYCQDIGVNRRNNTSIFGRELKQLLPGLETSRPTSKKNSRRRVYVLPSLEECRRCYDNLTRNNAPWPE